MMTPELDNATDARTPDAGDGQQLSNVIGTRRWWRMALVNLAGGVVGALPVLWVLGAVPWRTPSLLIEQMFRGFTHCALDAGALSPVVMVCERVGVPLGMHQLDGALSYPLGGVFIRLGVEPLVAWKLAVAVLVVTGFEALWFLGRRLTGSVIGAATLVVLLGTGATMTARSWSWYWNVVAAALLPVLFAGLHVLYERARERRLRRLVPPATAVVLAVVLIGLEWSYAGLFATAMAIGAVCILAVLRSWTLPQRALLFAGAGVGTAMVVAVQRLRLSTAGVESQGSSAFRNATNNAVDLVSFVAPDQDASFLGYGLARLGHEDLLVDALTSGDHLWADPYLGVLTIALFAGVYVRRRARLEPNPGCPPGYLPLLLAIIVGSIVLAVGPDVRVARDALPAAGFASPAAVLWVSTPVRWIRYPWTWTFVTHTALLLTFAALTPALLRRQGAWSPLVWVAGVVLVLEFVSPVVLQAATSDRPSVASAPETNRLSSRQPDIARFAAEDLPELTRALRDVSGTATLLPWGNTWVMPYLATMDGTRVRNVGIDRNLRQVERAAPLPRHDLRHPSPDTIRRMLVSGWTDAVVLLDYMPNAAAIVRHAHTHPSRSDTRRRTWVQRTTQGLVDRGYCVEPHSWFVVVTSCSGQDRRAVARAPDAANRSRRRPARR